MTDLIKVRCFDVWKCRVMLIFSLDLIARKESLLFCSLKYLFFRYQHSLRRILLNCLAKLLFNLLLIDDLGEYDWATETLAVCSLCSYACFLCTFRQRRKHYCTSLLSLIVWCEFQSLGHLRLLLRQQRLYFLSILLVDWLENWSPIHSWLWRVILNHRLRWHSLCLSPYLASEVIELQSLSVGIDTLLEPVFYISLVFTMLCLRLILLILCCIHLRINIVKGDVLVNS